MPRSERNQAHHAADAPSLAARFRATRSLTEALAAPLSDADASIQSMEDASPAKWHLAHTTWFWETFLLREHAPGYRLHDERWPFLFNSYYEAEGARISRAARGMLSRPTLDEVLAWRAHVTEAMEPLLADPALASTGGRHVRRRGGVQSGCEHAWSRAAAAGPERGWKARGDRRRLL